MQKPTLAAAAVALGLGLAHCGHIGPPGSASAVAAPSASSLEAAPAAADETPSYVAIVSAPDRDAADRALDDGRKPGALLAFAKVKPGMRVAELGAGGGYTAELLARAVRPSGHVYLQNSSFILERFAEAPLTARMQKPVMQNAERLDRPFDDPFPPEVRGLDLVFDVLFYHDTVWMKVDRARMNRAVLEALSPGGKYIVVDHASARGKGLTEVESLHRIEQSVVKDEIIAAGFELVEEADFLRNPDDTLDWSTSPRVAGERRGTSDRFVLAFRKPAAQ
jgi:predicted methyltransferase